MKKLRERRIQDDVRVDPETVASAVLSSEASNCLKIFGCYRVKEIKKAMADKDWGEPYVPSYVKAEINAFLAYEDAKSEAYRLRRQAQKLVKSAGSALGKAISKSNDERDKRIDRANRRAEYDAERARELQRRKDNHIPDPDIRPVKINGKTELTKGDVKIRSYKPEELTKSGQIKKSVLKQQEQVDEVYKRLRSIGVELED